MAGVHKFVSQGALKRITYGDIGISTVVDVRSIECHLANRIAKLTKKILARKVLDLA